MPETANGMKGFIRTSVPWTLLPMGVQWTRLRWVGSVHEVRLQGTWGLTGSSVKRGDFS